MNSVKLNDVKNTKSATLKLTSDAEKATALDKKK